MLKCLVLSSVFQVTGTSLHSTKEALRLTRLYPGTLYSTAGQYQGFIRLRLTDLYFIRNPSSRCKILG